MKRALLLLAACAAIQASAQTVPPSVPAYPLYQNYPGQQSLQYPKYGQLPAGLVCQGNDSFMDNREARANCERMEMFRRLGYGVPGYSKDMNAVHSNEALRMIAERNPMKADALAQDQAYTREVRLNRVKDTCWALNGPNETAQAKCINENFQVGVAAAPKACYWNMPDGKTPNPNYDACVKAMDWSAK